MKKYINHLITPQQITIIFDEGNPISIFKEDSRYTQLLDLLKELRDTPNENYDKITCLIDKPTQINEYTKGKFIVRDGVIHINNEALPNELSEKLLQLVDANEETRPLEKFWHNLKRNPSKESKRDLFAFLRANKIPITPNGCFIAYKKVRNDWMDCHTGTISNKPGTIVKMEREHVDGNRNNTCSTGLHVAAYSYASTFQTGIMLEVEVNPRDVVAVPPDYQQQKMRVCRYRVVRSAEKELDDLIYRQESKVY